MRSPAPCFATLLAVLTLPCGMSAMADASSPSAELRWHERHRSAMEEAGEKSRPVLIYFHAEWCSPCKRLDAVTLRDPRVVKYVSDHLVALTLDAEKGDGPALDAAMGVAGYPTMIVADPSGSEIDRIVGFVDPLTFLASARAILAGEDTFDALSERVRGGRATGLDSRWKLAQGLDDRGRTEEAIALAEGIVAEDPTNESGHADDALLKLAQLAKEPARRAELAERALSMGADLDSQSEVAFVLALAYGKLGRREEAKQQRLRRSELLVQQSQRDLAVADTPGPVWRWGSAPAASRSTLPARFSFPIRASPCRDTCADSDGAAGNKPSGGLAIHERHQLEASKIVAPARTGGRPAREHLDQPAHHHRPRGEALGPHDG